MQPLVLAIEPDLRQAAIVKRIVREKVLADVAVVDSRDAALEAMRTTIPDVLLLSALLSPRDEDELVAHLRTLQHAEHLQTHTIPQLASTIGQDDDRPRGLLSAFRRRKGSGSAPAGCDPDLFAEEIRTYLQRASERKRELRENPAREAAVTAAAPPASSSASPHDEPQDGDAAQPESSWASPFEWRPARSETRSTKKSEPPAPVPDGPQAGGAAASAPESRLDTVAEPVGAAAEPVVAAAAEPVVAAAAEPVVAAVPAAVAATPGPSVAAPASESVAASASEPLAGDPESVVVAAPQSVLIPQPRSVLLPRSEVAAREPAPPVRRKLPLSKRHAREWWFEGEDTDTRGTKQGDSEMRDLLASLSVPLHVATIGYADGCRIRRVRLAAE